MGAPFPTRFHSGEVIRKATPLLFFPLLRALRLDSAWIAFSNSMFSTRCQRGCRDVCGSIIGCWLRDALNAKAEGCFHGGKIIVPLLKLTPLSIKCMKTFRIPSTCLRYRVTYPLRTGRSVFSSSSLRPHRHAFLSLNEDTSSPFRKKIASHKEKRMVLDRSSTHHHLIA